SRLRAGPLSAAILSAVPVRIPAAARISRPPAAAPGAPARRAAGAGAGDRARDRADPAHRDARTHPRPAATRAPGRGHASARDPSARPGARRASAPAQPRRGQQRAAGGLPPHARPDKADALMPRILTAAAAQLGPIQAAEPRSVPVERMVRLLERAHARGVELVVFPELALTTFFPRHYHEDRREADSWFETAMPSNETAPLFEAARRYGIGFHLGYAELTPEGRHFNTAILVSPAGEVLLKYRKVHLPGHAEFDPARQVQHLEKRYFEVGDL